MALFFFHLTGSKPAVIDLVGVELLNLDIARQVARVALARHAIEAVADGHPYPEQAAIEICDEAGRVLDIEWCWCLTRDPTPFAPFGLTAL